MTELTTNEKQELKDIVSYPISWSAFSGMVYNNVDKSKENSDEELAALIKLALRVKVLCKRLSE
jgi:hypothetical protein